MRIQCKSCGRQYRVDEKRLTPEGIRVKCKSCSSILLIRLRDKVGTAAGQKEHAAPPSPPAPPSMEPEAFPELAGEFSPRLEPDMGFEPPPALEQETETETAPADEPGKQPAAAAEPESEPQPHPQPEVTVSAPEPAPEPAEAPEPVQARSDYRFCISCGRALNKEIGKGRKPVCDPCGGKAGVGFEEETSQISAVRKFVMFTLIILAVLFAAFLGYRLATGHHTFFQNSTDFEQTSPAPEN